MEGFNCLHLLYAANQSEQIGFNSFKIMLFYKGRQNLTSKRKWHGPAKYEIEIKGQLDDHWCECFEDIAIKNESGMSIITVDIQDQAALHGLLARIRGLGLPLISVQRV